MNITVTGRKMGVTDSLREYAEEKITNSTKVFDIDPMTAEIVLHVEKNPANPNSAVAEITIRTRGHVVRAEEAEEDMYAAIDLASEKVERQLRKYKTKVLDHRVRDGRNPNAAPKPLPDPETIVAEAEENAVVRTKYLDLTPMTEEDALLQTDLLGHDFFVFLSAETGLVNVIYHRDGGGYGIIKPNAVGPLEE